MENASKAVLTYVAWLPAIHSKVAKSFAKLHLVSYNEIIDYDIDFKGLERLFGVEPEEIHLETYKIYRYRVWSLPKLTIPF